jgi:hypothetical protein
MPNPKITLDRMVNLNRLQLYLYTSACVNGAWESLGHDESRSLSCKRWTHLKLRKVGLPHGLLAVCGRAACPQDDTAVLQCQQLQELVACSDMPAQGSPAPTYAGEYRYVS